MYAVSTSYLDALRGPHRAWGYVQAWFDGAPVTFEGETSLPLTDGEVTVDGATPGVRRTLSASFAPEPGLWDLLAPIGTELRAFTVLRFPDGTTETVPQGVFDVDVQRMGYAASGDIKVTAPDRWVRVQRSRFLKPRASIPGNLATSEIGTMLLEVLPAGTSVSYLSSSPDTVPAQTWDRDRDKAIQDMAQAASLDVFMDRNGNPVIRDAPLLTNVPVWTIDASATGVLIEADRERNRQKTYNIVVATSSSTEGPKFPPQFAWDNNPASPTYCGPGIGVGDVPPDPSQAGPFGQRPFFYSSPLLDNAGQALEAASNLLERVTGLAAQLTLSAVPNPALDDGDTILALLPPERRDLPQPAERHIVDALTVPLLPHKTPQSIKTRSTAADVDEGS